MLVSTRVGRRFVASALVAAIGLTTVFVLPQASADFLPACNGASTAPGAFVDAGLAADCLKLYGVSLGKADGTFGEHDLLSRSQISSLLVRFIGLAGIRLTEVRMFPDVTEETVTNAQVRHEIELLGGAGIISGFDDGTFRPSDSLTVAQTITLLLRTLGFVHAQNPNAPDIHEQGDSQANYDYAVQIGLLELSTPQSAYRHSIECEAHLISQETDSSGGSFADTPADTTDRGLLADLIAKLIQRLFETGIIGPNIDVPGPGVPPPTEEGPPPPPPPQGC